MIYIYILIDPLDNSIRYVGKTNNLKSRFRHEIHFANQYPNKCHRNSWIKGLLNKNILPIQLVIDEVDNKDWQFWEKHYISLYKSWGFNLTNHSLGGYGNDSVSDKTKKKISLALIGNTNKKGKKLNDIQKYNCGNGRRGTKQTKEHIELVSKPIIQYDLKGNFIKEWMSGKNAAHCLNISQGNINNVCNGKRLSAGGYKWNFKNNK